MVIAMHMYGKMDLKTCSITIGANVDTIIGSFSIVAEARALVPPAFCNPTSPKQED